MMARAHRTTSLVAMARQQTSNVTMLSTFAPALQRQRRHIRANILQLDGAKRACASVAALKRAVKRRPPAVCVRGCLACVDPAAGAPGCAQRLLSVRSARSSGLHSLLSHAMATWRLSLRLLAGSSTCSMCSVAAAALRGTPDCFTILVAVGLGPRRAARGGISRLAARLSRTTAAGRPAACTARSAATLKPAYRARLRPRHPPPRSPGCRRCRAARAPASAASPAAGQRLQARTLLRRTSTRLQAMVHRRPCCCRACRSHRLAGQRLQTGPATLCQAYQRSRARARSPSWLLDCAADRHAPPQKWAKKVRWMSACVSRLPSTFWDQRSSVSAWSTCPGAGPTAVSAHWQPTGRQV